MTEQAWQLERNMKMNKIKKAFWIVWTVCWAIAILAAAAPRSAWAEEEYCYVPYGVGVHPEFVAGISLVTMKWVDGPKGMEAWASYMYDEETNSTICVITARMPDQIIGDPEMDSLGHEFLHCVTGDFHEGEH